MDHKVLCIDDESHNLEALERLLRKKYSVVTASSGAEGLKQLNEHSFSLIISDQKMPEMTGVEFFMQAKDVQPEAVRILLTGYTDLESVISAINQGQIYRYITKPWEPEEFLGVTRQAIEVFEMKGTIARQNRELQKANAELMSLDKMKSDFMVLVNHELKTPLTGIFSYVQLLKEESLSEEQSLYIDKISKNTRRLQDLINDTLLITRLQATTEELERSDVDMTALIHKQWAETAAEFPKKSMTLDLKNKDSFQQPINQKYIQIVVKKLIHNCFAHGKSDEPVLIELTDKDQSWEMTIQNPLEKPIEKSVDQLLSAFSTSENIMNHSGGTGLGLAVIQGILNLFSGHIEIETESLLFKLKITLPKY